MPDNQTLPLLAVRDVVVYPHMQIALFVGREQSINAIELADERFDGHLLVVSQKDSLSEEISTDNLYHFGTVCKVISTMPHDADENCLKVLIEGQMRAKVRDVNVDKAHNTLVATFHKKPVSDTLSDDDKEAYKKAVSYTHLTLPTKA